MDWKETLARIKATSTSEPDNNEQPEVPRATEKEIQKHTGLLHIAIEKKGRGGKTATIIYGFNGDDEELQRLAKTLRQRLGTGGSARSGEILLQGNRKDDVIKLLDELGYKIR